MKDYIKRWRLDVIGDIIGGVLFLAMFAGCLLVPELWAFLLGLLFGA